MSNTEAVLTNDLQTMGTYFRKWRLKPNPSKTEATCFHLTNSLASAKLKIHFEGQIINHNFHPKYLGMTLDRTLSYKSHLFNTAQKLKTRNNIIQKLCGSSWGSSAPVLRTSALGLVYSAAEYCAPVWINSSHVNLVDVQLNHTMRLISGTIRPTPTHWLPTLSNIPPPDIRRKIALLREYLKIQDNVTLPIHHDIPDLHIDRLRSRHPPLRSAVVLQDNEFDPISQWKIEFEEKIGNANQHHLPFIDCQPPGFELPRKTWVCLNRIRTKFGNCNDLHFKWGKRTSPMCDCGADRQTIQHIVEECPIRCYGGDPNDVWTASDQFITYLNNLDIML
ncbi:hypothetical protein M8J77_021293 [Diaphorina citri]|nr:hypothetical protein M8J77_021293 [Diaphorina citri]